MTQGFNMSKEQTDWVLVPREPTPEMLDASIGHREPYLTDAHLRVLRDGFATKYRAMIAAAPTSPSTAGGVQVVTEEMVERAAEAIDAAWSEEDDRGPPFAQTERSYQNHCRLTARAAITPPTHGL